MQSAADSGESPHLQMQSAADSEESPHSQMQSAADLGGVSQLPDAKCG